MLTLYSRPPPGVWYSDSFLKERPRVLQGRQRERTDLWTSVWRVRQVTLRGKAGGEACAVCKLLSKKGKYQCVCISFFMEGEYLGKGKSGWERQGYLLDGFHTHRLIDLILKA